MLPYTSGSYPVPIFVIGTDDATVANIITEMKIKDTEIILFFIKISPKCHATDKINHSPFTSAYLYSNVY
jgi:hypothetical protein